jgi:histidine ammonia-lyase
MLKYVCLHRADVYTGMLLWRRLLVMAIELLMACQALDLLHPLTSTAPLQALHDFVRQSIP